MAYNLMTSVGEIVSERLGRWEVFAAYGIDFCCGGGRSLDDACKAAAADPRDVLLALAKADQRAGDEPDGTDWQSASLAALTAHITDTHHVYMKEALPRLAGLMTKVLEAHGARHPELAETAAVYAGLQAELEEHLLKEEQVLFPLICRMEAAGEAVVFHCGSVQAPIGVMEHEHEHAGEALRRLRKLTDDYTPPADACMTYQALLDGLAAMEHDLHIHIHKENNILHPRAAGLESSLAAASAEAGKGGE